MRYLIVLLALCWTARGANPSFESFNTNQFNTSASKVAFKGDLSGAYTKATNFNVADGTLWVLSPAELRVSGSGTEGEGRFLVSDLNGVLSYRTNWVLSSITNGVLSGNLSLNGRTNRLSISAGGVLLLDGVPITGGGGDTLWTNYTAMDDEGGTIQIVNSTIPSSPIIFAVNHLTNFWAGASAVFAIGYAPMDVGTVAAANAAIYGFGETAYGGSTLTNSFGIYAFGSSAIAGSALVTSGDIYALGTSALSLASLTNSSDVFAIGYEAGRGMAGQFSHVFLVGSGATATTNGDWVAGDDQYRYRFPGTNSFSIGSTLSLQGQTNRVGDNGTALTFNGVPIGGGDTTGTNIVTLTQTGTNASQMDFSLVARGGVFKLVLTNNAYFGVPANVNNTDSKECWLAVQQPSTGTCLVTFTNGVFSWPQGVAPVNDTNAGAVVWYQFKTDVFTNGLVHGWMGLESRLTPR